MGIGAATIAILAAVRPATATTIRAEGEPLLPLARPQDAGPPAERRCPPGDVREPTTDRYELEQEIVVHPVESR
jgi:hypothetical protein